ASAELQHVVGMSESYAECVDGFRIGPDSLACGLAVYTGQPVITADVTEDHTMEGVVVAGRAISVSRLLVLPDRDVVGKGGWHVRDVFQVSALRDGAGPRVSHRSGAGRRDHHLPESGG